MSFLRPTYNFNSNSITDPHAFHSVSSTLNIFYTLKLPDSCSQSYSYLLISSTSENYLETDFPCMTLRFIIFVVLLHFPTHPSIPHHHHPANTHGVLSSFISLQMGKTWHYWIFSDTFGQAISMYKFMFSYFLSIISLPINLSPSFSTPNLLKQQKAVE